jgi:hypothetical protein
MLCDYHGMRRRGGKLDPVFEHHVALKGLELAATEGCYICKEVFKGLKEDLATKNTGDLTNLPSAHATLSYHNRFQVYRLDFRSVTKGLVCAFVLEPLGGKC